MLQKAKQILNTLISNGHTAYLVGGCVRDLLLKRTPKDYDIVTSANSEEIKQLFPINYPVGEQFGIIKVKIEDDIFDVATYRSEADYDDGRRPSTVKFEKTPDKDVSRRDFTVNGLLMDRDEQIIDFVSGQDDLNNGIIRCIGNPEDRFSDDYLRVLRAVRFSCQLNFTIEHNTRIAIEKCVSGLTKISQERITEEFKKILISENSNVGLRQLIGLRILDLIIPEFSVLYGVEQPPQFHKYDVGRHTCEMFFNTTKPSSFELAMAILLHDIAKPKCKGFNKGRITFYGHEGVGTGMTKDICKRLKLDNKETDLIVSHVGNHMKMHQSRKMNPSSLRKLCLLPNFEELLELHRMDCYCSMGNMESYEFILNFYNENKTNLYNKPLLTGFHLQALGYEKGPVYKEILDEVKSAQLQGTIKTTGQAIDFVLEKFKHV